MKNETFSIVVTLKSGVQLTYDRVISLDRTRDNLFSKITFEHGTESETTHVHLRIDDISAMHRVVQP